MVDDFDVSDSTDWLPTPLAGLAAVEAALRCQMCKDFYKTPMLTSCSHTFCSLCIRHALSNDGRCPLCRNTDQELKLRNNWVMDEAVEAFSKSRKDILEFARRGALVAKESRSPKRKRGVRDDGSGATPTSATAPAPVAEQRGTKRLRSSARLSIARAQEAAAATAREETQVPDSEEEENLEDEEREGTHGGEEDDDYSPEEPQDGQVPCPICQQRMKPHQVFQHLDKCPGPDGATNSNATNGTGGHTPPKTQSSIFNETARSSSAAPSKPPERLPALSYSLLKDNALRKKMTELGLSTNGSRQLLERRHKEWITIWNANCDSARPKKRSELLQDLRIWEETQGGGKAQAQAQAQGMMPALSGMGMGRKAGAAQTMAEIKDKDFDGAAWATKHDTSFKDLIANARQSRTKAQETKGEDREDRGREEEGTTSSSGASGDVGQPDGTPDAPKPGDVADSTETPVSAAVMDGVEPTTGESIEVHGRESVQPGPPAVSDDMGAAPAASPSSSKPGPAAPFFSQEGLDKPPPAPPLELRTSSSQEAA